jgi:sugar phosphate isomerase/epimerase
VHSSPHVYIPFNKINEYIDFIIKINLNLELYFSSAVLDVVTKDDIISLRKTLDYNPSLSIHAPFMDLSPGAVDTQVRKATMDRFSHILDLSEILKPRSIVFHSGYEKWKYALNVDLWLEKSLMTWQPVNKRGIDMGAKIAIENIFEDEPVNLKLLLDNMNSDNFGICFDTGHFNLFSKIPLEKWMDSLNPYIIELHLHDNDRKSDQHLSIGEGTFDFENFFYLLKNKDCIYTIEARTPEDVLKSMEYIKKISD